MTEEDEHETESVLTTIDNPYDPFDDFDNWYAYDTRVGYNTLALQARVAVVSDELSDLDMKMSVEEAIDQIIKENVSGMHIKRTRSIKKVE